MGQVNFVQNYLFCNLTNRYHGMAVTLLQHKYILADL